MIACDLVAIFTKVEQLMLYRVYAVVHENGQYVLVYDGQNKERATEIFDWCENHFYKSSLEVLGNQCKVCKKYMYDEEAQFCSVNCYDIGYLAA